MAKTVSIRRSLIQNLIVVIALLSGAIMLTMALGARSAIRALSGKIIKQTIKQTESKLNGFFDPVSNELLRVRTLGQRGLINIDDPENLRDQLKSIMLQYPQITSLMVAEESGREFMLLHSGDKWLSRQMVSGKRARIVEWSRLDPQAQAVETEKDLDYDPRVRPWFIGATKKWKEFAESETQDNARELLNWTKPYTFFTTKEPGITVSIRFETPHGSEYVVGFDVLLKDIQTFTDELEILNQGQVVILTTEDVTRVVSFSAKRYFIETVIPDSLSLKSLADVKIPLIDDAVNAFRDRAPDKVDDPVRFFSEGRVWWGAGKYYSLAADRKFRMGVIVPESDMLGSFENTRVWILMITAGVLILGVMRTVVLANSYSKPIESLVAVSNRMSKGDLEPGETIDSPIRDILQLAEAHEHMRQGLKTLMKLEGDIRIARQIQQNTLPQSVPELPGFEIAGWNAPAEETGGDTYDIVGYEVNPETNKVKICHAEAERAILLLGDATGHGLGPALSVTQLRAMLRMAVHINPDIHVIAKYINEQLDADLPEGRFITAWLAEINAADHTLRYFSAGQAPLMHYVALEDKMNVLEADTYPLGIFNVLSSTQVNQVRMNPGDIFAVISDGIFEAANSQGEQFGNDRVVDILVRERNKSPQNMIDAICFAVREFTENAPADDDRTIIIIKRK